MENINELKNQLKSLQTKLSLTKNENDRLDIIYEIKRIDKKIRNFDSSKQNIPVKKPEFKKEEKHEFKKEDKKPEQHIDVNMDRGKVNEPANITHNDNKKEEKKNQ